VVTPSDGVPFPRRKAGGPAGSAADQLWDGCQRQSGQGDSVKIYRHGMWKSEPIKIMGLGAGNRIETDVAVLTLRNQLSPTFPMPATSADLVWGQNVYLLDFPTAYIPALM
jgi:hypothetical protein